MFRPAPPVERSLSHLLDLPLHVRRVRAPEARGRLVLPRQPAAVPGLVLLQRVLQRVVVPRRRGRRQQRRGVADRHEPHLLRGHEGLRLLDNARRLRAERRRGRRGRGDGVVRVGGGVQMGAVLRLQQRAQGHALVTRDVDGRVGLPELQPPPVVRGPSGAALVADQNAGARGVGPQVTRQAPALGRGLPRVGVEVVHVVPGGVPHVNVARVVLHQRLADVGVVLLRPQRGDAEAGRRRPAPGVRPEDPRRVGLPLRHFQLREGVEAARGVAEQHRQRAFVARLRGVLPGADEVQREVLLDLGPRVQQLPGAVGVAAADGVQQNVRQFGDGHPRVFLEALEKQAPEPGIVFNARAREFPALLMIPAGVGAAGPTLRANWSSAVPAAGTPRVHAASFGRSVRQPHRRLSVEPQGMRRLRLRRVGREVAVGPHAAPRGQGLAADGALLRLLAHQQDGVGGDAAHAQPQERVADHHRPVRQEAQHDGPDQPDGQRAEAQRQQREVPA